MDNDQKTGAAGSIAAFDRVTGKIRRFITDTLGELGRCSWPGRTELFESTILVIVVISVLALFVAGVDEVSRVVIRLITTGKLS